jgi:hypothetical protein
MNGENPLDIKTETKAMAMATDNSGTLALLIDGDNASPKIVDGLLAEIANYGLASVKRIYGDWTGPNLKGWKECLLEHSIQPVQQFAYTTGKNATDGAIIIDAMDLLYTGRFSGFCIVSSDSDFARLAARICEQGVNVYGFGERKTPILSSRLATSSFISTCSTRPANGRKWEPPQRQRRRRPKPRRRKHLWIARRSVCFRKLLRPRPMKTAAPISAALARIWRNSLRPSTHATTALRASPIWSKPPALPRSSASVKIRKSSWFALRASLPLDPRNRLRWRDCPRCQPRK